MIEDPETGQWTPAYVETAGGAKVPMVTTDEKSARRMQPIAERMAVMMATEWRLYKTTPAELVMEVAP
jgi:hypothetical protein